jgi:hypothetical protein
MLRLAGVHIYMSQKDMADDGKEWGKTYDEKFTNT